MSNKKVIVPQTQLDAIEQARLALYELLEDRIEHDIQFQMAITNITQPMWLIANTKWEEATDS